MSGSQRQSLLDSRSAAVRRASRIWAADHRRSISTGSESMSISSGSSPEVSQRNRGLASQTEADAGVGADDGTYAQDGVYTNGVHAHDGLEAQNGIHTQDGVYANGVHANGVHANRVHANGVYPNGVYASGMYANGVYADDEQYEEYAHHEEYANGGYTNGVHAYANGMDTNGGYVNGGYANGVYANDGEYAHGGVYANDEEYRYNREYARNGTYANGPHTNGVDANDGEYAHDQEYARNGTYAHDGVYANGVHANNGGYAHDREYARDGVYVYDGYITGAHDGSGLDADDEMDGSASYEASDYEYEEGYTQPAPYQYINRNPVHRHRWEGGFDADRSLSHDYQATDQYNGGLSVDASQDAEIIPSIEQSASVSDDEDEYSEPDEDEDSDGHGELNEIGIPDDNDSESDSNGELDEDGEPSEDVEPYEDGEFDEDSEANVFSQLSSRFERAANRNAPNQAVSSEDGDSESDSQDITMNYPPRRRLAYGVYVSEEAARQRLRNAAAAYEDEESDAADSEDGSGLGDAVDFEDGSVSGSSSELSPLGPTPEPPDPELMRIELQRKLRERPFCTCGGWCSCIKYKAFYGHQQTSEGSNATGSGIKDDGAKDDRDDDVEVEENEARKDDVVENGAAGNLIDGGGLGENAAENVPGEDEAQSSDEAAYQPFMICDPAGLSLPSQTHLSERVLAGEELPTSAIRTTLPSSERDDHTTAALDYLGEQVFSWDQRARPRRPPVSWVGGEWTRTIDRGELTLGSEHRHKEAGTRLDDANLLVAFHGHIRAGTHEPLGLQSGALAGHISNLKRVQEFDQIG